MKKQKWMPGRLVYAMLLPILALTVNPVAFAQDAPDEAYAIQNIVATSNAISEEGAGPENTVNGSGLNENDEHSTRSTDMWLGVPGDDAVYIQYEFDDIYELHEMWVWNYNAAIEPLVGFGIKDVAIEYSENGQDWTALGEARLALAPGTAGYTADTVVAFDGVSARYVRLTVLSTRGPTKPVGLSEVRFLALSRPDTPLKGHPIRNVVAASNAPSEEDEGPENTVNGSGLSDDGTHSTAVDAMWLATPGDDPLYIQFGFDRRYMLHEMHIWNYNGPFELLLGFGVKDVTIEYSANGVDWTVLGDFELALATAQADYGANTTIPFGGVTAQFVRMNVHSGHGFMRQYGLSEVRFYSRPAPPPSFVLPLDSFELYDERENRIFDTWLDGFVNETGSTVGYFTAPFAEQWIVNTGLQSMPLFYNNAAAPFYSEAHRELEPELQDWQASGADALTLYVHGSQNKDHNVQTDWLYVAVHDSQGRVAFVYHPDPESLLNDGWQEWTIALTELTDVDLSHVTRLIVGVGDRGTPQVGGSSVIYIDDIGLSSGL